VLRILSRSKPLAFYRVALSVVCAIPLLSILQQCFLTEKICLYITIKSEINIIMHTFPHCTWPKLLLAGFATSKLPIGSPVSSSNGSASMRKPLNDLDPTSVTETEKWKFEIDHFNISQPL